jgi:hypothetical protein
MSRTRLFSELRLTIYNTWLKELPEGYKNYIECLETPEASERRKPQEWKFS